MNDKNWQGSTVSYRTSLKLPKSIKVLPYLQESTVHSERGFVRPSWIYSQKVVPEDSQGRSQMRQQPGRNVGQQPGYLKCGFEILRFRGHCVYCCLYLVQPSAFRCHNTAIKMICELLKFIGILLVIVIVVREITPLLPTLSCAQIITSGSLTTHRIE